MTVIEIYTKLSTLPDEMKWEVNDFVDFLKSKASAKAKSVGQKERC